mmetsp:Transcript_115190/g.287822  ORF Transcript_115190/g.287822 Transcript_115190/m.287822 type:complete len:130 (-) Transcript_115190:62-451(-)
MSLGLQFRAALSAAIFATCATGLLTGGSKEAPMLAPVCHDITCAQINCMSPLELHRSEGQCCPICWAPDHVVSLDRHTALHGENHFLKGTHPAAPGSCAGAKCFHPHCAEGYAPGHVQGRCCESCVPGR